MMENDNCYRCGSAGHDTLVRLTKLISIVKCRTCGLARTYPYPSFDFEAQEKYSKFYVDNEKMFRMFARSMIGQISRFKRSGSFLDIGCAVGYLLDEAKGLGFATSGTELNRAAAGITRGKGHTVYAGIIEKSTLPDESFDVISFNHVLEHIEDYKPFLAAAGRLLKRDGIVYCGAPNYDSFMQKLLRRAWYGWGMPDHVWHFTAKTLKEVMEENGFTAERMALNALHYTYSKSLRKNTRATLARIAGAFGVGDQVYGIFGKKVI
jgi:2-polyprenyl-3-methyl-5-hydroxy-6-metoxy-1,4-benzoquinol methylase